MNTTILHEIQRLHGMTVGELQVRWRELYGEESRSRNKTYLWRRLAWRVQELAHGGLSDHAKERLAALGSVDFQRACPPAVAETGAPMIAAPPRPKRDPRLPTPGTVISRMYRGRELRLVVLDDGYELDGVRYGSLSEAARAVTGSKWNGKLFFGLTQRKRS